MVRSRRRESAPCRRSGEVVAQRTAHQGGELGSMALRFVPRGGGSRARVRVRSVGRSVEVREGCRGRWGTGLQNRRGRRNVHAPGTFVYRWHCVRGRMNGAREFEPPDRPGLKLAVAVWESRSFRPRREHISFLRSRRMHTDESRIDGESGFEVSIQR
jgi:hypothetical protein